MEERTSENCIGQHNGHHKTSTAPNTITGFFFSRCTKKGTYIGNCIVPCEDTLLKGEEEEGREQSIETNIGSANNWRKTKIKNCFAHLGSTMRDHDSAIRRWPFS